jgi:hypothetical protein
MPDEAAVPLECVVSQHTTLVDQFQEAESSRFCAHLA